MQRTQRTQRKERNEMTSLLDRPIAAACDDGVCRWHAAKLWQTRAKLLKLNLICIISCTTSKNVLKLDCWFKKKLNLKNLRSAGKRTAVGWSLRFSCELRSSRFLRFLRSLRLLRCVCRVGWKPRYSHPYFGRQVKFHSCILSVSRWSASRCRSVVRSAETLQHAIQFTLIEALTAAQCPVPGARREPV